MIQCFTRETGILKTLLVRRAKQVSDYIWETFDGLFKTVYRQGKQVEELEARISELERRLKEKETVESNSIQHTRVDHLTTERAA
jgi:BMFP domain-containing protein YqiC